MKINGIHLNNINAYNKAQRQTPMKKSDGTFADRLEISSAAKDMQVVSEYQDQRAERVQKLKSEIEAGQYKVNANKVAADMLNYYRF